MFTKIILILTLFLSLTVQAGSPGQNIEGIQELTAENFDSVVDGSKATLVEFYAPWCGHCKTMVGELQKLANTVAGDTRINSKIVLAKVNADKETALAKKYAIPGFPTFKFFPKGSTVAQDFNEGNRKAADFLKNLQESMGYKSQDFPTLESLSGLMTKFTTADPKKQKTYYEQASNYFNKLSTEAQQEGQVYLDYMNQVMNTAGEKLTSDNKLALLDKISRQFESSDDKQTLYQQALDLGQDLSDQQQKTAKIYYDYMTEVAANAQRQAKTNLSPTDRQLDTIDHLTQQFGLGKNKKEAYNKAVKMTSQLSGEAQKQAQAYVNYMKMQYSSFMTKGQQDPLDQIVAQYGTAKNKQDLYNQAQKIVEGQKGEAQLQGKATLDYMKQSMDKGQSFLSQEYDRVHNLIHHESGYGKEDSFLQRQYKALQKLQTTGEL